jgi:polyhydroxybutyrate depolymerase
MIQRIIAAVGLALCVSAAYGQLASDSLLVDGYYRKFHFFKEGNRASGASIVFVLHGSGGDGLGARKAAMSLERGASKENVLLVYPDGYKRYWNECRKAATSLANIENIDENTFFSNMITYFQKRYRADVGKVFVVGTSGGGHMAYKLALTMPEKITAVTAIIANLPTEANMDCTPAGKSLPVMIINGTKDPLNKYEGGEMRTGQVYLGNVRSTDETLRYWATLAGYQGSPKMTPLPDLDPADGKRVEKYVFSAPKKPEIVLLKVINGKHDYPGDIDVHLEAWSFFKRQGRK